MGNNNKVFKKCTKGIGTMIAARQPKRVFAHLKPKALNICVVNSGKAVPDKFPGQARMNLKKFPNPGDIKNKIYAQDFDQLKQMMQMAHNWRDQNIKIDNQKTYVKKDFAYQSAK